MGDTGEAGRGKLARRGGVERTRDDGLDVSFKKGDSLGVRGASN